MKLTLTSEAGVVIGTVEKAERHGVRKNAAVELDRILSKFIGKLDDSKIFTWWRDGDGVLYDGEFLDRKTVRIDQDPESDQLFVVLLDRDGSEAVILATLAKHRLELDLLLEYLEVKVQVKHGKA